MKRDVRTTEELIHLNAKECSDTPFLNFYDEIVTYRDLDDRTNAFARYLLENGVRKGDTVCFMMGNSPQFFYVLLGAQKIGATGVPVSCWWQAEEVEYLVNDCRPRILVVDPEFVPVVSAVRKSAPSLERIVLNGPASAGVDFPHESLPEILSERSGKPAAGQRPSEDDVAAVLYTSGTTGRPKGVMLTHRNILCSAHAKTEHIPVERADRVLCVLPLFHSGGLHDLALPCIYRAATIVLRRRFSASEFWECVEKCSVNAFYIVPTMWNILLKAPEAVKADTRSLRFGVSGAAPIPPEQLKECEERFHIPILEGYGSTENTGGITANRLESRKFGSVGRAFGDLEVRVVEPDGKTLSTGHIGEIVVRGDTVMKGYFNRPDATAETIRDGWLYTGDVGFLDADGFLFIVDRKKDMIIRGGVNVYPQELENLIATHPAVDSVAVIPEADEKYGQVAKACVVLKRSETATREEIEAYCRTRLAAYKVPETFLFRESLPTNAVGKIVKKELIRELEEEKTAEAVPVAHFFEGMPARFLPEKAGGVEATISYNITGKGGGKWTVTIKDGKMTLAAGILKNPRVYVVARDRDYHDIVTGKLDGVTAVVTGKMQIEGDVGFMAELRQMMRPL